MKSIDEKEAIIQDAQKKLSRTMDTDIAKLNRLNKILGNGVGLRIYTVTGGRGGH